MTSDTGTTSQSGTSTRRDLSDVKRALVVGAVAWLAMSLWALASPIGSVPDEPSHMIRAAVVAHGDPISDPAEENPALGVAEVPNYVAHVHEWTCFAFNPDISAGCMEPVRGDADAEVRTLTSAGTNSPAYYAVVGLPTVVMDGTPALYAMRIVNALLVAVAVGVAALYLPQVTRARWSWVALAASITPMVAYLGGSVNPNGLEAASAGALLVVLVAMLRHARTLSRRAFVTMGAWAVVAAAMLLSTRSIALLWVAIIAVAATVLADVRAWTVFISTWRGRAIAGAVALVTVLTLAWYLNPPPYADIEFAGAGTSPRRAFVEMALTTFSYWEGYVGLMGWVDTHSPEVSVVAFSVVLVGLVIAALAVAPRRGLVAVGGMVAVIFVAPAAVQAALAPSVGFIWQGRYMLAMVVVTLVVAGIVIDDARPTHSAKSGAVAEARVAAVGLVFLTVGHVATFLWTLRRYVVGEDDSYPKMLNAPEWQPPGGWLLLTALYAVTVAGVAAWILVETFMRPGRRGTTPQTAE